MIPAWVVVLGVLGVCHLLAESKLLDVGYLPIRPWLKKSSVLAGMLECTFCTGFWVALGLSAANEFGCQRWLSVLVHAFAYAYAAAIVALAVNVLKKRL